MTITKQTVTLSYQQKQPLEAFLFWKSFSLKCFNIHKKASLFKSLLNKVSVCNACKLVYFEQVTYKNNEGKSEQHKSF